MEPIFWPFICGGLGIAVAMFILFFAVDAAIAQRVGVKSAWSELWKR